MYYIQYEKYIYIWIIEKFISHKGITHILQKNEWVGENFNK